MLKMKLEALEHPNPDSVDVKNRKVFASTVLWLEDQKIRQYKIEDRVGLRKVDNIPEWEKAYQRYKTDVGIPKFDSPMEELSWLLSYAVRLEFLDAPENYQDINSKNIQERDSKSVAPSIKAENSLDNIDFQHKDFVIGVRAMAKKLQIAHHPDHLVQLEAIVRVVHDRLAPEARKKQPITGKPFPFSQGNDKVADDPALDYPVRVLRLLQIQSLRQLQTLINETIVCVQDLTANPKTDTKLGKVGF
ncbi:RNA transcription, translation and transport factor protein [Eupeodes corollae]|uniref:RNA transcription, translation and transport factor protein n=1 Tax=Eupeodes corollae TaxID=290404 RepID=UPI0024925104|nr:RNA transcription, translation and transport factor protein [Eupeodes corollae]